MFDVVRRYAYLKFVLITLFATSHIVSADSDIPTQSMLSDASQDRHWLNLLHYHDVGFFDHGISQADDDRFFISPNGKYDPKDELIATIEALSPGATNYLDMRCKYPARAAWISSRFDIQLNHAPAYCKELTTWLSEIAAEDLTLIFPAAYLNSPSSMFGHTLMRIDSSKHNNNLLSYSINYAANADPNDNELVFSYKGLTGGYPGIFSILPYYLKVKEYNYLESRDVWEYQLDITPAELELFMLHVWEIKETTFDYYFFTENCSYHLLTLLDAASPRFNLSSQFSTDVIPADTVRALQDQGLIQSALYRPSMQSNLAHQLSVSSDETHDLAIRLVNSQEQVSQILSSIQLTPTEKAQALELAVSLARYNAKEDSENAKYYNKRSIALLSARSKIANVISFSETPPPKTRDDQGHRSHRWLARAGHDERGNYFGLDLRMSYHDFLDPSPGYIPGALLELIHLKFKAYPNKNSAELEEFRAINIASFSPRNSFLKPTSWFVQTGLERHIYQSDELMPYLKAGPGLSYKLNNERETNLIFSLLLSTRLYADNDIHKGYSLDTGPFVHMSYQSELVSLQAFYKRHFDAYGADMDSEESFIGIGTPITNKHALRFGMRYQDSRYAASSENDQRIYDLSGELGLAWYF